MNRKNARETAMKILYQLDVNGDTDHKEYLDRVDDPGEQLPFLEGVLSSWSGNRYTVDGNISKYSKDWKIERMPKIDLAILREAVTEILYLDDIPSAVTINEAVEMAKKYGTDHAPGFVNAILGSIVRSDE